MLLTKNIHFVSINWYFCQWGKKLFAAIYQTWPCSNTLNPWAQRRVGFLQSENLYLNRSLQSCNYHFWFYIYICITKTTSNLCSCMNHCLANCMPPPFVIYSVSQHIRTLSNENLPTFSKSKITRLSESPSSGSIN